MKSNFSVRTRCGKPSGWQHDVVLRTPQAEHLALLLIQHSPVVGIRLPHRCTHPRPQVGQLLHEHLVEERRPPIALGEPVVMTSKRSKLALPHNDCKIVQLLLLMLAQKAWQPYHLSLLRLFEWHQSRHREPLEQARCGLHSCEGQLLAYP